MESEEFYDSLDESSDYENCICPQAKTTSIPIFNKLENPKDDLIPFYEEQLSVSQIDVSKHSSGCSGFLVQNRNTSRSSLKFSISPGPKPKKSYLEMFYDKTGVNKYEPNGNIQCDSSRPTCSSLSPRSFITCNGDVECDNVITVDFKSNSETSLKHIESVSPRQVPELNLQIDSGVGDQKFYSVSDHNMENVTSPCSNFSYNSKKSLVNMNSKGTDTTTERLELVHSKLEVWKRRQQYGMRASETNRIKMKEEKALKLLEKEMKNANTHKICSI